MNTATHDEITQTAGLLAAVSERICDASGNRTATCHNHGKRDARRFVAAWNACDGISTETLEKMKPGDAAKLAEENAAVWAAHLPVHDLCEAAGLTKGDGSIDLGRLEWAIAAPVPNEPANIRAALAALLEWGRTHTSPTDSNSPHALLVAACIALEAPAGDGAPIHRYLDLSTAHLDEDTGRQMADGDSIPPDFDGETLGYQAITSSDDGEQYGNIVAVLDTSEDEGEWPQCIRDCLARARALNCDYIRFDRDGQIDQALPVYDWEGGSDSDPADDDSRSNGPRV